MSLKKIREANLGKTLSDVTKNKLREAHIGKTHSDDTKNKIREAHIGKTLSDDHKNKIHEAHIGKTLSDDHKEKLRQANLGKTLSDVTKNKLREANLGKTLSDDHKEKLRQAKLGSNNHSAKPVVAFGKLFACGKDASDYWRSEKAPKTKSNFIKEWTKTKKHSQYVFWVSKEFYDLYKDSDNITREMYDSFK